MTPIDVTTWEPASEEPLGSKPKQWLRDPAHDLWLWKESTIHLDTVHGPFRKGDDWSEVIAGRLGERLGVPVARVRLATLGNKFGVVSRNVLDAGETLVHGNELLAGIGVGSSHPRDRGGYTVEAVARTLNEVGPPIPSAELTTAFDWFAGYLVLDALIGNTDRHQDNWATIRDRDSERLSPSFDHASSLGFQISDDERVERLSDRTNRTVATYSAGARTKFDGHPTPLAASLRALALVEQPVREHWFTALERCRRLEELTEDVPENRMSALAKALRRGPLRQESRNAVTRHPYDGTMNERGEQQERSLFVSWRDPETGSIHPIGRLVRRQSPTDEHYSFAYLKLAEHLDGFQPLPGLPDLHRRYDSDRLFPVFANRVMPRTRPDYDLLASRLDLQGDADPFEVLARTGGRRATDRVEVFAGPERTPAGQSSVLFFARGIRHLPSQAAEAVATLRAGDLLTLVDDRENQHNQRALLLRVSDGARVGWVPDYLVDHVHELRDLNGADPAVIVEHVNDTTVAPHMRLLCRLEAPWPRGYEAFSGPEFQTLADLG